jgi:hypothetical protein
MSDQPNLPPPVPSAVPQPARRLSKIALGIALLLGALLVTMGALVITSPPARSPLHTDPRDQRPAEATFLNNPPKHTPSSSDQREEERIARLLRLARDGQPGQPAPSGPLSLGVKPPAGPADSREVRDLRDPREVPYDRVDSGETGPGSVGRPRSTAMAHLRVPTGRTPARHAGLSRRPRCPRSSLPGRRRLPAR